MENIKIFGNEKFGPIRATIVDNEVWFVAKDVIKTLNCGDTNSALRNYVDKNDKRTRKIYGSDKSGLIMINKFGLGSLILNSKIRSMTEFKLWISKEIQLYIYENKIQDVKHKEMNSDFVIETYFSGTSEKQKILIKGLLDNIENQQRIIAKSSEYIEKNEIANEQSYSNEQTFTYKTLKQKDKNKINTGIKHLAKCTDVNYGKLWNEFYNKLKRKYGIDVKFRKENDTRKKKLTYISYIRENELNAILKTFDELCETSGESSAQMFQEEITN